MQTVAYDSSADKPDRAITPLYRCYCDFLLVVRARQFDDDKDDWESTVPPIKEEG